MIDSFHRTAARLERVLLDGQRQLAELEDRIAVGDNRKAHHLPLAQELDDVVHVRVVAEAEDVVVGHPGLLLWCNHESATWG